MADKIRSNEAAAIEAFLAKNKPSVIAPGGHAKSGGYIWDKDKKRLVSTDEISARDRYRAGNAAMFHRTNRKTPPVDPAIFARRQKLRELAVQGKTAAECAGLLDLPRHLIYADAKLGGFTFAKAEKKTPPKRASRSKYVAKSKHDPQVAKTRIAVRGSFDGVKTAGEISAETGIHIRTVKGHLSALGMKAPAGQPGPSRNAKIEARRAKISELVGQGLRGPQIAKQLGISKAVLSHDCKVSKVKIPRQFVDTDNRKISRLKLILKLKTAKITRIQAEADGVKAEIAKLEASL